MVHRLLLIRIEGNVVVLELLLVVVMMMGPDTARLLLGPAIHQDGLLTIACTGRLARRIAAG